MNKNFLESKVEKLEENQKILLVMLTDLAAETHTIRDYIPNSSSPSFDRAKEKHRKAILKHWESLRRT